MTLALSPEEARSIAVRAQLLDAERPAGVVETLDALVAVNIDPTAAIAPSADHILWSRIGWPYQSGDLVRAVEVDRTVFEWRGFYRPMADLPLYRARMRGLPEFAQARQWLQANAVFRADVLRRLADDGPLGTGEIPDTSAVPWASTGWTNAKNVQRMLEFLALRGDVAVSGRRGRERLWDLAERVYPDDAEVPVDAAEHALAERRLRSLGIARASAPEQPGEPVHVGEIGVAATVAGVAGEWRIDPAVMAAEPAEPRAALLSPFDRLVFDRARARELFGFEYILEMYKPAAQRRWGYFALPILVGDDLVGKLDAKADRTAGVLRVNAIHEDRPWDDDEHAMVDAEIDELAEWLGLDVVGLERA
ncbi:DNA glycosylase AlkZ-like family protein [Microbacterium sp. NPDC091313]